MHEFWCRIAIAYSLLKLRGTCNIFLIVRKTHGVLSLVHVIEETEKLLLYKISHLFNKEYPLIEDVVTSFYSSGYIALMQVLNFV